MKQIKPDVHTKGAREVVVYRDAPRLKENTRSLKIFDLSYFNGIFFFSRHLTEIKGENAIKSFFFFYLTALTSTNIKLRHYCEQHCNTFLFISTVLLL